MAVVIRMKRVGAKKRPFYRMVVADSKYPRDGRYIEQLGYYDPLTDPAVFRVDAVKFERWVRHGARPSEQVASMMRRHAPQALRPAPLASPPAPEGPAVEAPKKAKPAKPAKAAKPKAAPRKKAAPKKGTEKKAKARAKAKTKKASGATAKPKAAKKAKK